MYKQSLKYGVALIALYIGVANATGAGTLISSGASGGAKLVKTFQGRP